MEIPTSTGLALLLLVIALIGALAGTLGYAATIARRQAARIAELTEVLATSSGPDGLVEVGRIHDRRLRAGFSRLSARIAETWTLATIDPLTGVLNRQTLLARMENEIERAGRYARPLSIIMVDLDHFKRVNDTHGHAAGDAVLRAFAAVLSGSVRNVDIVGRYGGEEFMLVLPETDPDAAASIAEKLRRLVSAEVVVVDGGHRLSVTMSAGVAGGIGGRLTLLALIDDADNALYSAKSLGRDQVYVFREIEEGKLIRRAAIGPRARERALEVGRAAAVAATAVLEGALTTQPGWAGKPSTMIAEMAVSLARAIDLPAGEIERIRTASLLHDLGKLAIPDEILSSPRELSDPEWRVVSEHPKIGQVVLEQAGALRDAAMIVLHHHEWYDGRGYPYGLTGQEIPVGARIVAIADAYEAMVAGRPYRTAVAHEAALAELRRHAGVQFDPELVRLFAILFGDGVPWPLGHGIPAEVPGFIDARSHAEIHDAVHARRRGEAPPSGRVRTRRRAERTSQVDPGPPSDERAAG